MNSQKKSVTIIGAGLTGLMLSIYLAKRGYTVTIYDFRPDPDVTYYKYDGSGRAMSLDLSVRGLLALSEIGLDKNILSRSIPMKKRVIHLLDGALIDLPYGKGDDTYINTVARSDLHKHLLSKARTFNAVKIHFNQRFLSFDLKSKKASFIDEITQEEYTVPTTLLVGCDGVHSSVREYIEQTSGTSFVKHPFNYEYKALKVPASLAEALELEAMHMWPRQNSMLVAQPDYEGSFTSVLLLPKDGTKSFKNILKNPETIRSFFQQEFGDVCPLIPDLVEEMINNPMGSFVTTTGGQWQLEGKVLIMGDSAHSMTPFFGQGINCCFEDCYLLNKYLDKFEDNWDVALPIFEKNRKIDTEAIAIMSLENYPELTNPNWKHFILQREIEDFLMDHYKEFYTSYHNLVCFDKVPYRYAKFVRTLQKELIKDISYKIKSIKELTKSKILSVIDDYQFNINQYSQMATYEHIET
ncbi:FAD-dependent monooxygenase [Candidatus Neptunochlamydia vexilliferae]|uniref:Kynurenine 3-monooxygenase n=1 Tax=Candidatus Neptunichlamydia vexilliferae TaxID=1651774 RepID=A0ABS0AXD0_9BACT|nr:NAD(P)/FAD-dependent oxidoreductase [Candidatus Neptunochlamydia vexilliferae]MBF5058801.1 Kynurenine 3-monooxygenase [Candidatus Neptunochlamydia vexilliferae]